MQRLVDARHRFRLMDEEYSHVKMGLETWAELIRESSDCIPSENIKTIDRCYGFVIEVDQVMGPDRLEFYSLDKQGWMVSILLKGQIDYVRR